MTIKHGLLQGNRNRRLYKIWYDMKRRCYNQNSRNYRNYGGRGIEVCDQWLSDFAEFYHWAMENGYDDRLQLDRIDVNGDYEPINCRFATHQEQQNNRRNNRLIKIGNETFTCAQVCRKYGINPKTFHSRLKRGWTGQKLLSRRNAI
ncbi:hypothetical protein [Alkalihalobacterium chitinilyticum]|uniref:Uncharacterized protein n=1 Tax=Alkalihalobacterium chitinilyticum TaxID=2980103 RepID=A0ABT5VJ62_9BACI|nr:hypothetical protein [Alkalihalobacterium chitinilyticum]MDE5415496.1 hypothetical protein [Alkalihalobacterium chitinilyticum]